MTPREAIPLAWVKHLRMTGNIGLGFDVATTTKGKSNWSSLTVTQHLSPLYVQTFTIRWKSGNEEVALDILDTVISDIEGEGLRARRLCIDASNEKLFASRVKNYFAGRVPVDLVVSGETLMWVGQKYNYKTLLGSLYSAAFEDNFMAIANQKWLLDDHRLVTKEGERFVVDLGKDGSHGDTFDSGKLSYWALVNKTDLEPGSISAVPTSDSFGEKPDPPGLRNPLAHLFNNKPNFNA